jgi:hypothetical protein
VESLKCSLSFRSIRTMCEDVISFEFLNVRYMCKWASIIGKKVGTQVVIM